MMDDVSRRPYMPLATTIDPTTLRCMWSVLVLSAAGGTGPNTRRNFLSQTMMTMTTNDRVNKFQESTVYRM